MSKLKEIKGRCQWLCKRLVYCRYLRPLTEGIAGSYCWLRCLFHYLRYLLFCNPSRSVLLVEPNPWHGEVLPGYAKYFAEFGYEIVVMVHPTNYDDNPFVEDLLPVSRYCLSPNWMRKALKLGKTSNFQYVLLTSSLIFMGRPGKGIYSGRFTSWLGFVPKGKKGLGIIEHELTKEAYGDYWDNLEESSPEWELLKGSSFVLTACDYRGISMPMLNPHWFGEIIIREGSSERTRRRAFVVVGNVSKSKRDFVNLFAAIGAMPGNYEIQLIGQIDDPELLKSLPSTIVPLGRLSFSEMYSRLERANFLLPLLSPNVEAHRHYLHGCTSGSRQLSLGFCLPMVIQKDFADVYGFDSTNAVVYEDDADLGAAMQLAITMPPDEYADLCKSLDVMRQRVYDESLCNLKMRLEVRRC